jgi:hypothetical protein
VPEMTAGVLVHKRRGDGAAIAKAFPEASVEEPSEVLRHGSVDAAGDSSQRGIMVQRTVRRHPVSTSSTTANARR